MLTGVTAREEKPFDLTGTRQLGSHRNRPLPTPRNREEKKHPNNRTEIKQLRLTPRPCPSLPLGSDSAKNGVVPRTRINMGKKGVEARALQSNSRDSLRPLPLFAMCGSNNAASMQVHGTHYHHNSRAVCASKEQKGQRRALL